MVTDSEVQEERLLCCDTKNVYVGPDGREKMEGRGKKEKTRDWALRRARARAKRMQPPW